LYFFVYSLDEIKGKYAGCINQDRSNFFNQNLKNFSECIIFILVDELFSVYVCLYVMPRAVSSCTGINLQELVGLLFLYFIVAAVFLIITVQVRNMSL